MHVDDFHMKPPKHEINVIPMFEGKGEIFLCEFEMIGTLIIAKLIVFTRYIECTIVSLIGLIMLHSSANKMVDTSHGSIHH